jgi:hypothetical protein
VEFNIKELRVNGRNIRTKVILRRRMKNHDILRDVCIMFTLRKNSRREYHGDGAPTGSTAI